jgi:multiple sugar transport system permease protein
MREKSNLGTLALKEERAFYLFISPWIIGLVIFTAGPLVGSLILSFTSYNMASLPRFIGINNYKELIYDPLVRRSLLITTYYTVLSVPLGMTLALALAVVLNQRLPALGVYRTIFYLPSIVPAVASALLWQWLLNPEFGIVNYFLYKFFEIRGPQWFYSESWVIPSLALMSLWGVGNWIVIYLASLQGVPTTLYEAARIDGASSWTMFFKITLPVISPTLLFTLVTGIISAFQVFTQVYVITGGMGGPNYSSHVLTLYIYRTGFKDYRMGYASSMAWILFLIVLILSLIILKSSKKWVYYEVEQ